ncbi:MAG: DMT family transporter [Gammaproteobacteria bacterium]|nr:DMT family transporter [Gammaproteobacteria bacterium]
MNSEYLRSHHRKGSIVVILGVIVLSFDALLIRLADAEPWAIVFWRGALMGLSLILGAGLTGKIALFPKFHRCGPPAYFTAALQGFGTAMFVIAISNTSVANTVVLIATSPVFAALASHFFLKERVEPHTWIACIIVALGVALVFGDSFGFSDTLGNFCALMAALGLGGNLTILRRYQEMPRIPVVAVSGIVIALFALAISSPFTLSRESYAILGIMGAVQMPLALVLITSGTRYLTSPEVSLFLLLETLLGPVWVWLILGDSVSTLALTGGAIIVATLLVHSWKSLQLLHSG